MEKIKHTQYKNKSIYYSTTFIFIIICNFSLFCQKASPTLDSIYRLEINNNEKIKLYKNLINSYSNTKQYTQLGYDAHQIAKWLNRQPNKKKETFQFLNQAIDARTKAIPFNAKLLRSSYNNLGLYNLDYNQYTASIKAYKKLLTISGSDHRTGSAYHYIGKCHARLGDPSTAIENYTKAFQHLKKNERVLITNHIEIADAYYRFREKEKSLMSIKHIQIADSLLSNSKKINKYKQYRIYADMATFYSFSSIKDTIKGVHFYHKALDLATHLNRNDYASLVLYNLGLLHIGKDNDKSLNYLNKALSYGIKNHSRATSVYYGLGRLESNISNYKSATNYFHKSLSSYFNIEITPENFFKKITSKQLYNSKNKPRLLEILSGIINNYIIQGKQTNDNQYHLKAIEYIKTADKLIDIVLESNISYNTKLLQRTLMSIIYTSGIEACITTNQIEYGFYLSEKNKGLLLIQDISKNIDIPTIFREKKLNLEQRIIYLQNIYKNATSSKDSILNKILVNEDALEKLNDSIAKKYPTYSNIKKTPKITALKDIKYRDDEVIIQYIMTENIGKLFLDTYCLVLTKNHKKIYRLENSKNIQNKVKEIRKQLNSPFTNTKDITLYKEKAYELYLTLIPKEITLLIKNKKVKIITDHILSLLPFEALVTNKKTGKYLIEDCEINYIYSLSFEKQNNLLPRDAKYEFLGMAPVDFSEGLMRLRNSEKELANANSYYSGKLLTNEEATKENFINHINNHKIIHLATHANASDSIAPWITFRNNKLIASELGLLNHQAEMVVLSACNTSLGKIRSGEGVQSLARGFFKSGAKSVIPSLWSTNDKATANITSDFYKNLSQGKTKSAALRAAKLNYLNDLSDADASPHYWAPLILIGNNSALLPETNYNWIWYLCIIPLCFLAFIIFKKKT